MKIGERIEAEMKRRDWSEGELARRAGIPQPTVHRIIKGESKSPRQENIQAIAKAFGCSIEWLWSGVGKAPLGSQGTESNNAADKVRQMLEKHGRGLPAEARQQILQAVEEAASPEQEAANSTNVITADFSRPGPVGDEIRIAHYDVRAALGGGQVVPDYPEMMPDLRVSKKHLQELGVTYNDASHLKILTGFGQSMAPTIQHLDPMIVDVSIRDFQGDGIYAFSWQQHFYVKRLQVADAEHFEMISDNPNHKDRLIRMDETYIQARVLLIWNAKKA
ncbi:XRE family transcriptional regulator [Pseudomonas resinovorans]|uniref:XRE family transcriptional regulator n=1 Tax=Metapseudomonas resinovorans TaxID=53412 RepID=A0ABT4YAI2_METRE|nr:XRE family transcriptional regulator [Pseudomonas resinovorans]MDA8485870.1 XRE family transcriptional regulator [Pseudomonas resinovorans]